MASSTEVKKILSFLLESGLWIRYKNNPLVSTHARQWGYGGEQNAAPAFCKLTVYERSQQEIIIVL